MPVIYNSKKIIPAPFISINREIRRGEDGSFRKVLYKISVKGTIIPYMGSPNAAGTFHTGSGYPSDDNDVKNDFDKRLAAFRTKKGALSELFCTEGKLFEIQPYDGSAPIKFIPRIQSINFAEGNWVEKLEYTIDMEADEVIFGDITPCTGGGTNDADETWAIEQADEKGRTYKITHTVSAQSYDEYDSSGTGTLLRRGWEVSKEDKVEPLLGFDTGFRDDSLVLSDLDTYTPYNYVRSETIDEKAGKYSITENWLLYNGSGAYLEDYTVNTRISAENGLATVSVEGTLTGFEVRDNTTHALTSSRYTNVQAAWASVEPNLFDRAEDVSELTLNADIINKTIGRNVNNGIITYNYEYTNRPCPYISGAISENVNVTETYPLPLFAKHTCIFRPVGPVLQPIYTQSEHKRNMTLEVQMPALTGCPPAIPLPLPPNVSFYIEYYYPSGIMTEGPYVDRNEENWNPFSGKYTRNVSWSWVA